MHIQDTRFFYRRDIIADITNSNRAAVSNSTIDTEPRVSWLQFEHEKVICRGAQNMQQKLTRAEAKCAARCCSYLNNAYCDKPRRTRVHFCV